MTASSRPRWALIASLFAGIFGAVTIAVGGGTIVGLSTGHLAPGNIVVFVLWFNFLIGFAYIGAAVGLFFWFRWAAFLSAAIALATVVVFIAFGIHVLRGGAFETRTVAAMAFRSIVWIAIAGAACRALGCSRKGRTLHG